MSLEIVRRIRGNVHGTIDVSELEDAVIGHEYFQRLRRVKQLAFLHYVFPGASHSRFEHSLGVMHLAAVAWDKLKVNQRRIAEAAAKVSDFSALEKKESPHLAHGLLAPTFPLMNQIFDSDYHLQVLRLAALLHDVGHPPFSHSGERFLPSWEQVLVANSQTADYLKAWLSARIEMLRAKGEDPGTKKVRHEVYSLLMVERILKDTYQNTPDLRLEIDPRDVVSVIHPEIKPSANSPLLAHGLYRTLHELISGELDIDRMDYLLRDSRECGVVYGLFDAGRILDSLCIYQDNVDKGLHVAISSSGLAAFEDYLRARQSMYLQVYFHKTAASAEAMMQHLAKLLGGWHLPPNLEEYAEYDDNLGMQLQLAARERLDDMYILNDFNTTLKNLLYHRRLWKRVYEFDGKNREIDIGKQVQHLLEAKNIEYESVSSSTTLTRFQPRERKQRSPNYLRLIRKNPFRSLEVVPIEDHLSAIQQNEPIVINRLYANAETAAQFSMIKQEVFAQSQVDE